MLFETSLRAPPAAPRLGGGDGAGDGARRVSWPVRNPRVVRLSSAAGGASGDVRPPVDFEVHLDARPGQHVDKRIDAEAMETPTHEIAHAGLAHAQEPRCPRLREPAARNQALEGQHQVGPDAEVPGLHSGESQVAEHIVRALRDSDRHYVSSSRPRSRVKSLNRARARSRSSARVRRLFFAKACSTYTASVRVARYNTLNSPSARIRISRTPGPTCAIGFQSLGS